MVFQKSYAFMNSEIAFRIGSCRFGFGDRVHFGDKFGTYGPYSILIEQQKTGLTQSSVVKSQCRYLKRFPVAAGKAVEDTVLRNKRKRRRTP